MHLKNFFSSIRDLLMHVKGILGVAAAAALMSAMVRRRLASHPGTASAPRTVLVHERRVVTSTARTSTVA